jgi:hypothetical protein
MTKRQTFKVTLILTAEPTEPDWTEEELRDALCSAGQLHLSNRAWQFDVTLTDMPEEAR